MKDGYTHITVVLDRSGSMHKILHDTIGGFNAFLEEQQKQPGEATFSLVGFDDRYEVWRDFQPIGQVQPLTDETFKPRGSTALLDAIGRSVEELGARLAQMPESERPSKVFVVIITDGFENASTAFDRRRDGVQRVFKMVQHQEQGYQWQFLFLGANQDAIATAAGIGIPTWAAMSTADNRAGTLAAYKSVGRNISASRMERTYMRAEFSTEDRKKQQDAGAFTDADRRKPPADGGKKAA